MVSNRSLCWGGMAGMFSFLVFLPFTKYLTVTPRAWAIRTALSAAGSDEPFLHSFRLALGLTLFLRLVLFVLCLRNQGVRVNCT